MMKRAIRSVVLAGVIVIISILLSAPQPVQAGKSPTMWRMENWVGHIHLRAQADSTDWAFYSTFFETRGPINLILGSSYKNVEIHFDPWNILQGVGDSVWYGAVVSASAGSTQSISSAFSKAPSDTDFPFFTIAFSVIDPKFTAQNCWQTEDDYCSKIVWGDVMERVSDLATFVTHMKLEIIVNDGDTLSGTCSLPGWDEITEPHMTYSETCMWSAHHPTIRPEWRTKK
jgi:hypothetical protein